MKKPHVKKEHKKLKVSVFELVWYILCGLVGLWGLTYVVLGLLAKYLPIIGSENPIRQASDAYAKVFGMGFLAWGLIHCFVAAVLSIIVLLISSKKYDRDVEKAQRRAAIRATTLSQLENLEEEKTDEPIEATPVEEKE